jgi:hypothetical protein
MSVPTSGYARRIGYHALRYATDWTRAEPENSHAWAALGSSTHPSAHWNENPDR